MGNNNVIVNFLFQFSRLFNLGFNRKKFEVISTKDKLWAVNTSKNTFIALLFTLFSCGLLFTGVNEALIHKSEITTPFIIIFFIIHPIIGLMGLRQFLWLINGKQELTIENGNLTLIKKGTFLTRPKTCLLDNVNNIRLGIDEDKMTLYDKIQNNMQLNVKVIFGHTIGQIIFDYEGQTIKIFNDLDEKEREELLTEIIAHKEKK